MTTYENLLTYVNSCVDDMNSSVDWARDKMEDKDHSFRINWALDSIELEESKGHGACVFASIYDETITDEQYDELKAILHKAWCTARDRAFKEIH